MQLGFVIDQSRCIGCHACTVACKAENDVPVGEFRTWVKYTEDGAFPQVKRSFAVLRCNQCTDAPCVAICPVSALEKRTKDGIVDIDPKACIGCKACMQGCPYDAIYISPDHGTAEKCHFCAHRTEQGLAPACAVVCPTEAIVPGDFHDPASRVSTLKRERSLTARKTEAGTGPNVWYVDAHPAGTDPLLPDPNAGSIWTDAAAERRIDPALLPQLEEKARPRTVLDTPHAPPWGGMITWYLFLKSLAAGMFLPAGVLLARMGDGATEPTPALVALALPLLALLFLVATSGVLVADLKRPERFWFLLARPNWRSWLAKGTVILSVYGALLTVWLGLGAAQVGVPRGLLLVLLGLTMIAAALSACYTGWLFAQAKARVLWMRRGLWLHLIVQAAVGGPAVLLALGGLARLLFPTSAAVAALAPALQTLTGLTVVSLLVHLGFTLAEPWLSPAKREREYRLASHLVTRGPWAAQHWGAGVGLGIAVPVVLLLAVAGPAASLTAAVLALAGLLVEEHVLVRAGQALPNS